VPAQINYLQTADQIVATYVNDLGARKDELLGENASAHYVKMKEAMQVVFPDYAHSYMIEYGVYGLALSK